MDIAFGDASTKHEYPVLDLFPFPLRGTFPTHRKVTWPQSCRISKLGNLIGEYWLLA
jgi:hypothetical protein